MSDADQRERGRRTGIFLVELAFIVRADIDGSAICPGLTPGRLKRIFIVDTFRADPIRSPTVRSLTVITKVQMWGNSLGLRIPKVLAEDIGVQEGGNVDLKVEGGRLVVEPVRAGRLDLANLLSQVTPENLHGETETGARVGRELW